MNRKDHVLLGAALAVSATENWLSEHVDPETGYVLDNTLAVEGAAADSKAVGDALALKVDIADIDDTLAVTGAPADAKATGDAIAVVEAELGYVTPEMYGAKGDGTTDDTEAVQSALNTGKSVRLLKGSTYLVDALLLSGKSYVRIGGEGILKRKNSSAAVSGNYDLLRVYDCENILIDELHTDGNVANNGETVTEGKLTLRISASSGIVVGTVHDKNPASDTVYISGSTGVSIGNIISESDDSTGRQALTIVSGEDIYVGNVFCLGTGHESMPGGIDIETSSENAVVRNVFIGNAYIETAGFYGFCILNNATGGTVENIHVQHCVIDRAVRSEARETITSCVRIYNTKNVSGRFVCKQIGEEYTLTDNGLNLGAVENADIELICDKPKHGIYLDGKTVSVRIKATLNGVLHNALQLANGAQSADTVIDAVIRGVALGGQGGNCVYVADAASASNVTLHGDFTKVGDSGTACINLRGTISGIVADGVNMSGWAVNKMVLGTTAASGGFIGKNCKNYNFGSAAPTSVNIAYTKGSIVENTSPAAEGFIGWICTETGRPGTWKGFGAIEA